jgi:hypothetical protein
MTRKYEITLVGFFDMVEIEQPIEDVVSTWFAAFRDKTNFLNCEVRFRVDTDDVDVILSTRSPTLKAKLLTVLRAEGYEQWLT